MIGGGFGRRAQPDFVVDAVLLSKIVGGGTPVKAIYSREDDVAAGRMRPMTAHKIDVGLDKDGKIVGWKHRVVGESTIGYTNPGRLKKSGGKDVLVMAGSEVPNYGIPNWMAHHVHEKRARGYRRGVASARATRSSRAKRRSISLPWPQTPTRSLSGWIC